MLSPFFSSESPVCGFQPGAPVAASKMTKKSKYVSLMCDSVRAPSF